MNRLLDLFRRSPKKPQPDPLLGWKPGDGAAHRGRDFVWRERTSGQPGVGPAPGGVELVAEVVISASTGRVLLHFAAWPGRAFDAAEFENCGRFFTLPSGAVEYRADPPFLAALPGDRR